MTTPQHSPPDSPSGMKLALHHPASNRTGLLTRLNMSLPATIAVCVLTALAMTRIVATYFVFTQIYDEPAHICRGTLWLKGEAYIHTLHPPLAPACFALGAAVAGAHADLTGNRWEDGNALLHSANYSMTLAFARAGNLLFFVWAVAAIALWSTEYFDETCTVAAVLTFSILPPVLANAGLATTDLAITATLCTSIWMFQRWLDHCNTARSFALGLCIGLTLLSKLSAVAFLPACFVPVLVTRCGEVGQTSIRARIIQTLLVLFLAGDIVWMGYRCSFGSTVNHADASPEFKRSNILDHWWLKVPVPAPEFVRGLTTLMEKNEQGHGPYFKGKDNINGSLDFFPTVFAIKTPIGLLILFAFGSLIALRGIPSGRSRIPLLCCLQIMAIAMCSRINLGIRHVLPLYPMFSICVGLAVRWMWSAPQKTDSVRLKPATIFWRSLVVACLCWSVAESLGSHPDYLAYFNSFAGDQPDLMVVDSDLDWGQDLGRLARELKRREADHVYLAYFGTANLERHGLPRFDRLSDDDRVSGLVAASTTYLRTRSAYNWLLQERPVARIGKSILLFDIANPLPDDTESAKQTHR